MAHVIKMHIKFHKKTEIKKIKNFKCPMSLKIQSHKKLIRFEIFPKYHLNIFSNFRVLPKLSTALAFLANRGSATTEYAEGKQISFVSTHLQEGAVAW